MSAEQYEIDLHNLLAESCQAIDWEQHSEQDTEQVLSCLATEGIQSIVSKLFALPAESIDFGALVELPEPKTALPRAKPVPKDKPLTRWEEFAKLKGIKNKKRDRMVWDEFAQDWKPRFGAGSAKKVEDDWVIEHRPGDDPSVDPFERRSLEKQENKLKNKRQQMKNLAAAEGERVPGTIDLNSAIDKARKTSKQSGKRKHHVDAALDIAQRSTASMGKFDKLKSVEPAPKKVRPVKDASKTMARGHVQDGSMESEHKNQMRLLNRVLARSDKKQPVFDAKKALDKSHGKKRRAAKPEDDE